MSQREFTEKTLALSGFQSQFVTNSISVCYKLNLSLLQTQSQFVTNSNPICYKLKSNLLQTQT